MTHFLGFPIESVEEFPSVPATRITCLVAEDVELNLRAIQKSIDHFKKQGSAPVLGFSMEVYEERIVFNFRSGVRTAIESTFRVFQSECKSLDVLAQIGD